MLRVSGYPDTPCIHCTDITEGERAHPAPFCVILDPARGVKIATDALELDEEDIHDEHPSHVVLTIMRDEDNERKLNELNLDDFAVSSFGTNQDQKRSTLFDITAGRSSSRSAT